MVSLWEPGSNRPAGKAYAPFASLTTVTVMVEPCFFALTSTPSIGPSRSDATVPLSAGGAPCARTDPAEKASHAATAEAAIRANSRARMRSSRSKVRSGADNVNAINIQIGVEGDHETSKT